MEFNYKVKEYIAKLSDNKGYTKELLLISYNDKEPVYDLRNWLPPDEDGNRKMGKGLTLNTEELKALRDALNNMEI